MRKLYVVVSYEGRTDEQVQEVREEIKSRVEDALVEEFELLLPTPGLKRVASEIDAVLDADLVILSKGFQYSMPSRVVHFAASNYKFEMYEEDWIEVTKQARIEEEALLEQNFSDEEVPDEDVPA